MKLPVIEKRYIPWGLGALALVAIFATLSNGSAPSAGAKKYAQRYEDGPQGGYRTTWGDTETGDIYGWIANKDGSDWRFVRYDKVSESKARAALNGEPEVKIVYKEAPAAKVETQSDVRSGRIFERSAPYKSGTDLYNINARIKYREKENRMLYRFAVSIAPKIVNGKPQECVTDAQVKRLKAIASTPGSAAQMRFEDSDKFWVKDISVPLAGAAANNKVTSVTDSEKDKCGKINTLVFHNRADMTLPDFSWIENGKLLFNGVKFQPGPAVATKPQKKA